MSIFIERTGELVNSESTNLAVNISTTVLSPIYATMLTATITTVRPSSYLDMLFYAAVRHTGIAGVNVAAVFRLRVNGVLVPISRSCTQNQLTHRIMTLTISRRIVVTAGLQTVLVEWSRFGGPLNTLRCDPATLPDLHGAHFRLQEQAS